MQRRGTGNIINNAIAFEAEYQAVLDYASGLGYTLPTTIQNIVNNQAIIDLKAIGVWTNMDALYRFNYGDVALENFSLINWASVTKDLTKTGTPIYGSSGWYTNNISNRLTPSWKFNTLAHFTQNNGYYAIRKDVFENAYCFGVNQTSRSIHSTFSVARWDTVIGDLIGDIGGTRMMASSGTLGAATVQYFDNGVSAGTDLNDETLITTNQPYILTANGGGSFSTQPMQALFVGGDGATAKANAATIDTILKSF